MADTKISALTSATALAGSEVLPAVQSGSTVGATVQQVVTAATGSTGMPGATVTASAPVINHTQTWNNSGVTFTGWKINITDAASSGSSLLADLQVGGTSQFRVGKDGTVYFGGSAQLTTYGNGSGLIGVLANGLNEGARFWGPDSNRGGCGFAYGVGLSSTGTVSSNFYDVALIAKQSGVAQVQAQGGVTTGTALLLGVQTVAQLPTAAAGLTGARATVSDATQTYTSANLGATVTGGGSNKVPVFCNGSAWVIGG